MRLPPFTRTTTFRLSLVYVALILVYSAGLIGFIYSTTVGYMQTETDRRIESEIDSILLAYDQGGLSRVSQSLFERAAVPNRYFLYQLETPSGIKLSGDLTGMPSEEMGEIDFEIDVRRPGGDAFTLNVEGRIVNLGTEARLLVAYDAGERGEIVRRLTRAIYIAAAVGLILSLIGGVLISRAVARRAQSLVDVADEVVKGDLTQRAEVKGVDDEFDRLAKGMNAMLNRLQALVKNSRHAGDAIAHDLRSPLSRMRNHLETALSDPNTERDPYGVLARTIEQVDGVLSTFNAILRLSKLDSHADLRMEAFDAQDMVEEMSELLEPSAEESGLKLVVDSRKSQMTFGDRDLIAQALFNLIDNAIKYTPAGGMVRVSALKAPDNLVEFQVKDTGIGIPEDERERVKRRFHRMDRARTEPGSGLGLALVEAVAHVHEGRFDLLDGDGPPERPGLKAILGFRRA
ncbi:MAG: HAMP domain-containing sensor histidine kinase [Pseudomonadota bacterium]